MRRVAFAFLFGLIPVFSLAQNNPIFGGNSADGYSHSRTSQESTNSILTGGRDDGFAESRFSNVAESGIIGGGMDDGYSAERYSTPSNNQIFSGGSDDGWDNALTGSISNNSIFDGGPDDGYHVVRMDVFAEAIGPFPVELLLFDALKREDHVELQWVTTQEINLDRFEVERAGETGSFEFLLQQSPLGGPGEAAEYLREDEAPLIGRSYYRLRTIDLDGTESYSQTVEIIFDHISGIALVLFPNPTNGEATLRVTSGHGEITTIQIYDLLGREISALDTSLQLSPGNTRTLSVTDQPEGIYLIKLSGAELDQPITLKLQKR